MTRKSSPELPKIKALIAATNIPRERVLAAYRKARTPALPSDAVNFPWGHPGFPKQWPERVGGVE